MLPSSSASVANFNYRQAPLPVSLPNPVPLGINSALPSPSGAFSASPTILPTPSAFNPAMAPLPASAQPLPNNPPVQYVPFFVPVNLQASQLQDLLTKQSLQSPITPVSSVTLPTATDSPSSTSSAQINMTPPLAATLPEKPQTNVTDFTQPLTLPEISSPSSLGKLPLTSEPETNKPEHWQDRLKHRLPYAKHTEAPVPSSTETKDLALVIGEDGRIESPPGRKGELFAQSEQKPSTTLNKPEEDSSTDPLSKQAAHLASQLTDKYLALRPDDEETVRKVLSKGDKLLNDPEVLDNLHQQVYGYYHELGIMKRPARWLANRFIKRLPEDTEFHDRLLDKQTVRKAFDWVSQPLDKPVTELSESDGEATSSKWFRWPFKG